MKGFCRKCGEYTDVRKIVFTDEEDIDFLGGGEAVIYICVDEEACRQRRLEARRLREEVEDILEKERQELDRLLEGLIRVQPFRFDRKDQRMTLAGADVVIGTVNGHRAVTVQYGTTSGVFYYALPDAGLQPYIRLSVLDEFFGD